MCHPLALPESCAAPHPLWSLDLRAAAFLPRGSGVVGEQPILNPGKSYEYTSACPINTSIGTMQVRGLHSPQQCLPVSEELP